MQLNEKFEILNNPGLEYWEEHVAKIYNHVGWTYSKHDIKTWETAFGDQCNFCVLVEKATKKYVGGVVAVVYETPKLLAVGTYFLLPEYRGLNLGIPLWDKAIGGDVENKALVAAERMSPKYAVRDGFDKFFQWSVKRNSMLIKDVDPKNLNVDKNLKIFDFHEVNFDQFMEFDKKITGGLERGNLIKSFLTQPGAHIKVITSSDNEILGYCNIRECYDNNLVVGPFYAQNLSTASTLFRSTLESIPNLKSFNILKMSVPSTNVNILKINEILSSNKFEIGAQLFIQFTHYLMKVPEEEVYAVTDCTASYC